MNVSRKILVIIYIVFALLISVVIFASQSILYSSFSDLQEKEAADNIEKVEDIIDFQILHIEKINYALSSRDDVRNLILNPHPQDFNVSIFDDIFSVGGYNLVFLVNRSGDIVYYEVPDPETSTNNSALLEIRQRINDGRLLSKGTETPAKGLFLLEDDPVVISSQPVFTAPANKEISGRIILGKKLDSSFIESVQNVTGNTVTFYSSNNTPPDFQKALFESKNSNLTYVATGERFSSYAVLNDISGSPTIVVRSDADRSIYAEGKESLQYIVLFLLLAGLIIGASCKFLLDKEVVSRIVAIDNFVGKVRLNDNFSERFSMDGNDELSRLSEGINQTLDRLKITTDNIKVQEQEKKLILDSLSELVVFMDSELRIIWLNKAALDHVGMKLNDVIGRHYHDVYILYKEKPGKSPVLKAFESGNEEFGEVVTHDGKTWTVSAIPLKDENGMITGILKTGIDITAHRHSEEKLIQAKLEAEEANNSKSEFLANMSHELRTPLNSIIGFSDLLLEKVFGELNEKQLRYVSNISTSGKNLLALINDILDLSKVEAGKMELHYSEFSIDSVFEEVKSVFSPLVQVKSLELTINIYSGFTTLEADKGRLIQILYNLISNAIKFTPNGGKVSIYCKKVEVERLFQS